jgi:hypothetical protein
MTPMSIAVTGIEKNLLRKTLFKQSKLRLSPPMSAAEHRARGQLGLAWTWQVQQGPVGKGRVFGSPCQQTRLIHRLGVETHVIIIMMCAPMGNSNARLPRWPGGDPVSRRDLARSSCGSDL